MFGWGLCGFNDGPYKEARRLFSPFQIWRRMSRLTTTPNLLTPDIDFLSLHSHKKYISVDCRYPVHLLLLEKPERAKTSDKRNSADISSEEKATSEYKVFYCWRMFEVAIILSLLFSVHTYVHQYHIKQIWWKYQKKQKEYNHCFAATLKSFLRMMQTLNVVMQQSSFGNQGLGQLRRAL